MELQKFSSQANPAVIGALKQLAKEEGRQFQHVLNDAMETYVRLRKNTKAKSLFLEQADKVMDEHATLLSLLAK